MQKQEDVVTIEIWADSYLTKKELCNLVKNNIQEKRLQDNK